MMLSPVLSFPFPSAVGNIASPQASTGVFLPTPLPSYKHRSGTASRPLQLFFSRQALRGLFILLTLLYLIL